jgi:hypothetical protein
VTITFPTVNPKSEMDKEKKMLQEQERKEEKILKEITKKNS